MRLTLIHIPKALRKASARNISAHFFDSANNAAFGSENICYIYENSNKVTLISFNGTENL